MAQRVMLPRQKLLVSLKLNQNGQFLIENMAPFCNHIHPEFKVLYAKCYKHSNESCTFLLLCRWGPFWSVCTENSEILLNNSTYEGRFFMFLWTKKWKNEIPVHGSICTKKFINIKLKKLSIFASKYTCWCQNRLKHTKSIRYVFLHT